jgi:hypothetical protein
MLAAIGVAATLWLTPVQYTKPVDSALYPQTAGGDSCEPKIISPEVDVKSERNDPTFTYSQSTKNLTQKSAEGGTYRPPGATGPSWHTGGLTQGMFTYKSKIPAKVITGSNGISCIIVESVQFDIILTPQVWVANDYPPGSCMYNAVHEHEMKHVNVDRTVTDHHLPQIRADLTKFSQQRGFFGPGSSAQVKEEYDTFVTQLGGVIKSEIASMSEEDSKLQQQVDTIQEYQRVSNLCAAQLRQSR